MMFCYCFKVLLCNLFLWALIKIYGNLNNELKIKTNFFKFWLKNRNLEPTLNPEPEPSVLEPNYPNPEPEPKTFLEPKTGTENFESGTGL